MGAMVKILRTGPDMIRLSIHKRGRKNNWNSFCMLVSVIERAVSRGKAFDRDIFNFAHLTCYSGRLWIEVFWLNEVGRDVFRGFRESVSLEPEPLLKWLRESAEGSVYRALSKEPGYRTKVEFSESGLEMLRKITNNPVVRNKFRRAISRYSFNRCPDIAKVVFDADFAPFSFFWQEYRPNGARGIVGGLIFHDNGKDLRTGRYAFHT